MAKKQLLNILSIIPNCLSFARIFFTPVILILLMQQKVVMAGTLYFILAMSDFFDGYLARKLEAINYWGWLIDSGADFFLIISLLGYFCYFDYISFFSVIVTTFSFATFILTGVIKSQPYDVFGKFIGLICYICIGTIIFFPLGLVGQICDWIIKCYIIFSQLIKYYHVWRNKGKIIFRFR